MKSLARISAIGILGLGLCTAAAGQSEPAATQGAAKVSAVGPMSGVNRTERQSNESGDAMASTDRRGGPGSAKAVSDERKPVGAGYSWSAKSTTKPATRAGVDKPLPIDPRRPLAQAPSFEMRPDGSSVVTLVLSRPTEVTRLLKGRRVEYSLAHAQIGVTNNTNPLVTAHFTTPVERVRLRRNGRGATLVLILREEVQPTHQIVSGPAGTSMLEVTLPRPTQTYASTARRKQPKASATAAKPRASQQREGSSGKRPTAKVGPGPRL